jgi:hypothetical protein
MGRGNCIVMGRGRDTGRGKGMGTGKCTSKGRRRDTCKGSGTVRIGLG